MKYFNLSHQCQMLLSVFAHSVLDVNCTNCSHCLYFMNVYICHCQLLTIVGENAKWACNDVTAPPVEEEEDSLGFSMSAEQSVQDGIQ